VSRGAEAGGGETRGTGTGAAGTGGPSRTMGEDSEGQSFGGP
jgi:HSP20 family protein